MPHRRIPFRSNHFYHIYNRGINQDLIFFSPDNYHYFQRLLRRNIGRYHIAVVAYCLLPNHYHLLLRPRKDDNLSQFINSLFGSYTQAVNKQQGRLGPLFQGRFHAILVDKEEYLIHLARYIHLNPVTSGLSTAAHEWPYSNYVDVVTHREGDFKDTTLVPERFSSGEEYRKFVKDHSRDRSEMEGLEGYLLE